MYGDSAGQLPSQVKIRKLDTKDQNTKRARGENIIPLNKSLELEIVNAKRNKTDKRRPITPPSLLGIERRIAYAKRKYHSG